MLPPKYLVLARTANETACSTHTGTKRNGDSRESSAVPVLAEPNESYMDFVTSLVQTLPAQTLYVNVPPPLPLSVVDNALSTVFSRLPFR